MAYGQPIMAASRPKLKNFKTRPTPVAPVIPQMLPTGGLNPAWFMNEYKMKDAEANAKNEQRYGEILGGYNDRYTRNMGMLEGMGKQEAADINEASGAAGANVMQQLNSSGLAGTTVAPTMQMGVERQRVAEQARLNERLRQQKLAADMQLSGDTLRFKEAREDVQPDMGTYANIAMQLGAGGGNLGGGYGGAGGGGPSGGMPGGGYGGQPGTAHLKPIMLEDTRKSNFGGPGSGIGGNTAFKKFRPLGAHEIMLLKQGGIVGGKTMADWTKAGFRI